ncbi:FaeA-like protein [Escherichia coli]|uniref:FaeA/PapI family transcriptional regulator n=1 Tax=Escherichia coli TaxID=562 RepID=UPI0019182DC1|nr:FaeA/PapI family transcriptional regulator [Escherichia coli]CAD5758114.1 FaeA-like protein [Escherichia coli]CAD5758864.1 FaeA-like protein [Escherichia coli]
MARNKDEADLILNYMKEKHAPVKTRQIAELLGVSVYSARYHLRILQDFGLIESVCDGQGKSILWRLAW